MMKWSLLAVALLAFGVTQAADYSLDLLVSPRSSDEAYLAVPAEERADVALPPPPTGGAPRPTLPFQITGVSLERTGYQIGEEFTYSFALTYTGAAPFTFPTSTEPHLFRKAMPGLRLARIALRFEDGLLGTQAPDVQLLLGSDEVPGSLVTLTTNQTIRVRSKGEWHLTALSHPLPATWSRTLTPFVVLGFDYLPQRFDPVRSIDNPTVQLVREP